MEGAMAAFLAPSPNSVAMPSILRAVPALGIASSQAPMRLAPICLATTVATPKERSSYSAAVSAVSSLLVENQEQYDGDTAKRNLYGDPGKIFVGNLPTHLEKSDIRDFFQVFGSIRDVILIRDHNNPEKNAGYCFVFFEGSSPHSSAVKAREMDGAQFHGRPLRVKLDDGRWERARKEERNAWALGAEGKVARSDWHQEREHQSQIFREALTKKLISAVSVQSAFDRIEKPKRGDYSMLVTYYAKRGDKHSARAIFEKMRAARIPPNVHVYTSLVHAYAMANDMRGAVLCADDMSAEGIQPNEATYSVIISGFARSKNIKYALTCTELLQINKYYSRLPS